SLIQEGICEHEAMSYHELDGTIEIPEICVFSIKSRCRNEATYCRRLHARQIWHWQLFHENRWLNFSHIYDVRLEKAFQKVELDDVLIPAKDLSDDDNLSIKLSKILGTKSLRAYFKSMKMVSVNGKKTFEIRRLSTASSSKFTHSLSSHFGWFFKDNAVWRQFGHHQYESQDFQTTSDNIECKYQKGEWSMVVNTRKGQWILNFPEMRICSEYSLKTIAVRRRPIFCRIQEHPKQLSRCNRNMYGRRRDDLHS
ncbi:hypothetical protein SK128_004399, partial [Halocaridina rubra]